MSLSEIQQLDILRQPDQTSKSDFDVIIIGGGIYGVMLLLEATRRQVRALLLERDDFGSGSSFNWLHILHGGFRYLQSMDLKRFFESVAERSWYLRMFPDLVYPLPCLMPLYGKGLRRPGILRWAVLINDLLSHHRNDGLLKGKRLPQGQLLSRDKTLALAPSVRAEGLQGGAVWYDAFLPESPILIKEVLRWCCARGARVLNYVAAHGPVVRNGQLDGVKAVDLVSKRSLVFRSRIVVNAAGPWGRKIASAFDRDKPELFSYSKAWNVLFDHAAVSDCGLAVTPDQPKAHTYFLLPWKGRLMAGTGHTPCDSPEGRGRPNPGELQAFIADLNAAMPALNLKLTNVQRIFSGLLPSVFQGTRELADREVLIDHGQQQGPEGLFSMSGVKFTTARLVAEKTIRRIFPSRQALLPFDRDTLGESIRAALKSAIYKSNADITQFANNGRIAVLKNIAQSESVVHLDDLIFRRTNLWEYRQHALELAKKLCESMKLDDQTLDVELRIIERRFSGEFDL
jgi:glycerol-3-phosphate dehydrogenase